MQDRQSQQGGCNSCHAQLLSTSLWSIYPYGELMRLHYLKRGLKLCCLSLGHLLAILEIVVRSFCVADLRLYGRDAERMADLAEKVAEEQQQFIRAQWLDAQDVERFRCMYPRVEAQLQVCAESICTQLRHHSCHPPMLSRIWAGSSLALLAASLTNPLFINVHSQLTCAWIAVSSGISALQARSVCTDCDFICNAYRMDARRLTFSR